MASGSPHKRLIMQKTFPCLGVLIANTGQPVILRATVQVDFVTVVECSL